MKSVLPLVIVSIPLLWINMVAQSNLDMHYVTPLLMRPLIAFDTFSFYLYKLFWPLELLPAYGRSPALVIEQGYIYWSWIPSIAVTLLAWKFRARFSISLERTPDFH